MQFVVRELHGKEWITIQDECIATSWSGYVTRLTMAGCARTLLEEVQHFSVVGAVNYRNRKDQAQNTDLQSEKNCFRFTGLLGNRKKNKANFIQS